MKIRFLGKVFDRQSLQAAFRQTKSDRGSHRGRAAAGLISILLLFWVSTACAVAPLMRFMATETPTPTDTPTPTATLVPTITLEPTVTPSPTQTPNAETGLELGEPVTVAEGGFSIRLPKMGYESATAGPQVVILNNSEMLVIVFSGGATDKEIESPEQFANDALAKLLTDNEDGYELGQPQTTQINGLDGITYDLTGSSQGVKIHGQIVFLIPNKQQYFFGVGYSAVEETTDMWNTSGSQAFAGILNSVAFFTPEPAQAAQGSTECTVSNDSTYGYTKENPIKVGGDAFGGPSRERGYLDNLLGPNGESVAYERTKSEDFGDTILDDFNVTVAGNTVVLYVDEYSYATPQAPVGFTCPGAFPFAEP